MTSDSEVIDQETPVDSAGVDVARRRGCRLPTVVIVLVIMALIIVNGGWLYLGSSHFAGIVRTRVEETLTRRLDRRVEIENLAIDPGRRFRVTLTGLRIANVESSLKPWFASVESIEVVARVDSVFSRRILVESVEARTPSVLIESYPPGYPLRNNIPKWLPEEPRRIKLGSVVLDKIDVTDGALEIVDLEREIRILTTRITTEIAATSETDVFSGRGFSPRVRLEIPGLEPVPLTVRGEFRYEPNSLTVQAVRLLGRELSARVSGEVQPLRQGRYEFSIHADGALERVAEITRLTSELKGAARFDGRLAGQLSRFELRGNVSSSAMTADVYSVSNVDGDLTVTNDGARLEEISFDFHRGHATGSWRMQGLSEPRPMSVDLSFEDLSLEDLLANWEVPDTGLLGRVAGRLDYSWEGDDLFNGTGSGEAAVTPAEGDSTRAPHRYWPRGEIPFSMANGVVSFTRARFSTSASNFAFEGSLALEDLRTSLRYNVRTTNFADLDRLGQNVSMSLGETDSELQGLLGSGSVVGTIEGTLREPIVEATLKGTAFGWRDVVQGSASIDMSWGSAEQLMVLRRGEFRSGDGSLAFRGKVALPKNDGPPRFDIRAETTAWSLTKAAETFEIDLDLEGRGSGSMIIRGTNEEGLIHFNELVIDQDESRLTLNGIVAWHPGEGNVSLDLDIGANAFSVASVARFLEMDEIPVTGTIQGTLHLEGPREALEGAGAILVRQGSILDEPFDLITADLNFDEGTIRVPHFEVQAPAGTLQGEVSWNPVAERISYVIEPTELELAKIKALEDSDWIEGRVRLSSSGNGPIRRPDFVFNAVLLEGRIHKSEIDKEDGSRPEIYLSARDGKTLIRGSAFDVISVNGEALVTRSLDLDGFVDLEVVDLKRLMAVVAPTLQNDVLDGRFRARVELGGNGGSFETLNLRGRLADVQLKLSGHDVISRKPVEVVMRDGRVMIESMSLEAHETEFHASGSVNLTGDREVDVEVRGAMEAALIELFVPTLAADGHFTVSTTIGGTLDGIVVQGNVEINCETVRFVGLPQVIKDLQGTLILRRDRIEIDSMTASFGRGRVVAGGFVTHDQLVPQRMRITAQGKEVTINYLEGLTVDGDFDVVLTGDMDRMLLQGNFDVTRGVYGKDFDFATSLLNLLLERRELVPEVAASWQDTIALRVKVDATDALAVRNNVANLTASANLDVSGTLSKPIILGKVTLDEGGELRFQDIQYRVARGTVSFQNPFRNDPYIDVTAESRISRATEDLLPSQEYELTVNLTGTLDRIQPTISSDPPIGELTLLTLLAGDPSVDQSLAEGSISMAGASMLLSTFGSKILPFADNFRVDPGLVGDSSSFAPTVTVDKQISDELNVVVIYETGSTENREIVQWRVSNDWVLQFTRDSRDPDIYIVNAVDARFRRRYKAHWGSAGE